MMSYEGSSVNAHELTGNIYNIEDKHIGTNTRKNYYHTPIDFIIFMLTNSPDFIVFSNKI